MLPLQRGLVLPPDSLWDQHTVAPQMSYFSDYLALAQTKKEPEGYEKGRNSVLSFRVLG